MILRATLEKKEEKERVRVALMRAALRLAAVHGFAGLGLREVAREAGIAPTSFYRHFADMEELGTALIRELAGRVVSRLADRVVVAQDAAIVPDLIDALFRAIDQDPELLRFMVAERTGANASLRALLRGELGVLARSLHAAVSGQKSAPSTTPPIAAEAAVSLLFDGASRALDEDPSQHAPLREALIWSMRRLLIDDAPAPRSP